MSNQVLLDCQLLISPHTGCLFPHTSCLFHPYRLFIAPNLCEDSPKKYFVCLLIQFS